MPVSAYLSSTPRLLSHVLHFMQGSHQAADCWSAPRACAPLRFSQSCPHLLRHPICSTLWPDRSIMIPVACYRLISSNLTVIAGYFPLPGQIKQPQTDSSILGGISLPLSVRIMAYPLTWLTLITIATGTYLMNGYELFKVLSGHKKTSHFICR